MSDFSKTSVDKAVLKDTMTHPASVYPAAGAILGGVGFFLFHSPVALAAASAGVALGVGGWVYNHYYRRGHFSRKYLDALHEQIRQETKRRMETLVDDLKEAGSSQGLSQLPRLKMKFENFVEILDSKLEKEELTYGRYLGVAEQVYLAMVDNLMEAAAKLKSVSAIDDGYIRKRLKQLAREKDSNDREEESALKERLLLMDRMKEEAQDLFAENEAAMTKLDTAAAALTGIKTKKGQAAMDMEYAINELEIMAGRAHMYDLRKNEGNHG